MPSAAARPARASAVEVPTTSLGDPQNVRSVWWALTQGTVVLAPLQRRVATACPSANHRSELVLVPAAAGPSVWA